MEQEKISDGYKKMLNNKEKLIPGVISKESEVESPVVAGNIPEGHEIEGMILDTPEIGKRFNMLKRSGFFSTSPVQEIIYSTDMEVKFKTDNSVYLLVMPK